MATPEPDGTNLDTTIPNLLDANVRSRLASALPAVLRMLEAWELNRADQASVLTLSPRTLQRVAAGGPTPRLNQGQLLRLSLITGIYSALHTLFDDGTADAWMTRPNRRPPFGGHAPMRLILHGGIPSLLTVRRMLDADRSGRFGGSSQARLIAQSLPQPEINLPEA